MVMLVREMCTVCSSQDTFGLEKGNNIPRTHSQQELLILFFPFLVGENIYSITLSKCQK